MFWSFLDDRCGPATEDGIHVHPGQIILFSPFQTSTKIFQSHKYEHINIQPIIKTGKESAYNAGEPVQLLGQEDPLEKGQATHYSIPGLPLCLSW